MIEQHIGDNSSNLVSEAKKTGKANTTFRKGAAIIHRLAKNENGEVRILEQVKFATGTREGILADKKFFV